MQHKGKRYRFVEDTPKEDKIRRALFVTTLIIIAVGIASVFLFVILFKMPQEDVTDRKYTEDMTLGVELITEPAPTYPTYFTLPAEDTISSSEESTTQATTAEPTEVPTEEYKSWLIDIDNPDYDYDPQAITLTDEDRYLIAKIVMREFGDGGYEACCLQAQAFRDAMVVSYASAEYTYHYFQYDAYPLKKEPNQDCYDAVDYIFAGNMAVPHRILYMYAPEYCSSSWHESQNFVVEHNGVRFFDMWD